MRSITESLSNTASFTSFTHSLSKKSITGANKNMQFSTRNSRWGQWTVILIWFYFVLKKPVSQRHRELIKQAAAIIVNSLWKHHSMWRDINQLGGDPPLTENCTAKVNHPKTAICSCWQGFPGTHTRPIRPKKSSKGPRRRCETTMSSASQHKLYC